MTERTRNYLIFTGFIVITVSANYLLGSMAIYGAAAFTEFHAVELFGSLIIVEALARSISLLLSGRIGERYGRKRLFLLSTIIFGAMVAVAALSNSGLSFLWSRGLASFFWGLSQANVFTMVSERFSEEEYPIRVGWLQTVGSLILLTGPVICGVLIQQFNWRVSLLSILPLFLVSLLLIGAFFPKQTVQTTIANRSKQSDAFDKRRGLKQLFSQKSFVIMVLLTFLYTCISTSGNYIPLFAQTILQSGATISSLILVPCNILVMFFSNMTGRYIARHGFPKRLIVFMAMIGVVGSLLYTLTMLAPTYLVIILSTAVIGSGFGMSQVLPIAFVQRYTQKELIAEGTSFIIFTQGFSSVIAGVMYSAAMNSQGLPFALSTSVVYGVILFLLAVRLYREPTTRSSLASEACEQIKNERNEEEVR
ncbi:MFS transporter [Enterococcus sp. BWR-S5]|uniref:MFS transporter n=1 Tax=Enterococcus sp. BWR-S5 TaxID=2787714 RepID=UPI0019246243|nr:MFS transporter [Enterococcus sp. BWR-S5]MBL1225542.1 MFS transporter [Enterococcus sp. BWR-S5]